MRISQRAQAVAPFYAMEFGKQAAALEAQGHHVCERALQEAHVALTPGRDFGLHTAETHVRLSYAASTDDLREGIARLGKFVAALQ